MNLVRPASGIAGVLLRVTAGALTIYLFYELLHELIEWIGKRQHAAACQVIRAKDRQIDYLQAKLCSRRWAEIREWIALVVVALPALVRTYQALCGM